MLAGNIPRKIKRLEGKTIACKEIKQMEMTVYNPQKCRLETIDAVFTDKNTTWFDNCIDDQDIYMITDFEGGILISEFG
jgi:hypothetical protein